MLKPLALAMLIAAQPALAATWSYDFSGTLSEHFDHVDTTAPTSAVSQTGGQLVFYIPATPTPRETSEVFLFKDAAPSFQYDWSARVDVVVPPSLNQQIPRGNGNNAWAATSLLAFTTDGSGNLAKAVYISLEATAGTVEPAISNLYDAAAYDLVTDTDYAAASRPTTVGSATLRLSFDAASKKITASEPNGSLLTADISGWGLTATDTFRIGIAFDTRNLAVPQGQAMTLDNFILTTAVPEPAVYVQLLAGLGLVGFAIRRRSA